MSRLIDADFTLKQYNEYCKNNCKYTKREQEVMCRACPTGDAIEMLEDAPTVDAIPRSEIEAALEEMEALEETEFHMPNTDYEAYAVAYHCVEILKKHMVASAYDQVR